MTINYWQLPSCMQTEPLETTMPAAMTVAVSDPHRGVVSGDADAVFIGQVVSHLTDDIVTVWALDAQRGYQAYGFKASEWPIGQIVEFRLSSDGRSIDGLSRVGHDTEEAYRAKRLIPE